MSSPSSASSQHSLQEIIVTLPRWAVGGLLTFLAAAVGVAIWVALNGTSDKQRELATSLLLVLVPTAVAVAAAVGVRRSSTDQVDELVTHFLEHTVLSRLNLACEHHNRHPFPFKSARLEVPTLKRSFAEFKLAWATHPLPDVQVQVKMNVVNLEIMTGLVLQLPAELRDTSPQDLLVDHAQVQRLLDHPIARHLAGALQGAIEEGYVVRLLFGPVRDGRVTLNVSVRQKLETHFLASPYLKRYFAEDATIFIGWLFTELAEHDLLLPATG